MAEKTKEMADRKRLAYTARFVIVGWLVIAGVIGLGTGIYYLCGKNETLTIYVSQFLIYSGGFCFMGWQQYKWKANSAKTRSRNDIWDRLARTSADKPDDAEDPEDGWNRHKT
jgi:hypothetical protein